MKRSTANKAIILFCWFLVIGIFIAFLFIPLFTFTKTSSLGYITEVVTIKFSIADLVREKPQITVTSSLAEGENIAALVNINLEEILGGENVYRLCKRLVPPLIGFVVIAWFAVFFVYSLFFLKTNKATNALTFSYVSVLVFVCIMIKILPTTCVPKGLTSDDSWLLYIVLFIVSFVIMEIISSVTKGKQVGNTVSEIRKANTSYNGEYRNIVINDFGENKTRIIKEIMNVTDINIVEASNIAKTNVVKDLPIETAQDLAERLNKLGASIEIM